jgi:hypothetical protein
MKMPQPLLARLRASILKVCQENQCWPSQYAEKNPTFTAKRVRWDYFWAAKKYDPEFGTECYAAGLNDTHIDTALRSIVTVDAR